MILVKDSSFFVGLQLYNHCTERHI